MMPNAVLAAAGVLIGLTFTAHGQVATTPGAVPDQQLTFAQSGIRLSLGNLAVVQRRPAVTVIVQNDRDAPVQFAALSHRTTSNASQAVLTDTSGSACLADSGPAGIAQIAHLAQTPKPTIPSMTTIPPRSRMNAVFRFGGGCGLSGPPLSFAGEFALSTNGRDVELVTVPFWGITPKTTGQ